MSISFSKSLLFRLIWNALLYALGIGFVIGAFQASLEYNKTLSMPDNEMHTIIGLLKEPAQSIVFSFDAPTASKLLSGALRHPAIKEIKITLPTGEIFAEQKQIQANTQSSDLSNWLFGQIKTYKQELNTNFPSGIESLGELKITVDMNHYGTDFLSRIKISIIGTLFYAFTLSAVMLAIAHILVTKPLASVISSIGSVKVNSLKKARLRLPEEHQNDEIGILVKETNKHLEIIDKNFGELQEAQKMLRSYSDSLEEQVKERTSELSQSLERLKQAQNQLIESEKFAALGGLVAGVAHEVNTPLGISVTATSSLMENIEKLKTSYTQRTLTSEQFEEFIGYIEDASSLLTSNLKRAAKLIKDFKQTAVDQVSESQSTFDVKQIMDSLIASLHPETAKLKVEPQFNCDLGLKMNSLPGVLTQVITNLILNSLRHAFSGIENPQIIMNATLENNQVIFTYSDNGVGVPKEHQKRLFEPFFTTKRTQGGSGLGLNIVYNLVTRKLLGSVEFSSTLGKGMQYTIKMPQNLPSNFDKSRT